jgi:hypothetical protein
MYKCYKELLELIDINEKILNNCKQNLRDIELYMIKSGQPKGYGKSTSFLDADCVHGSKPELRYDILQQLVDEQEKLGSMIYLQESILAGLYKTKKEIDDKLNSLEGLEHKVFYKRFISGKSIKTTWSELEDEGLRHSYKYIENIYTKVGKM